MKKVVVTKFIKSIREEIISTFIDFQKLNGWWRVEKTLEGKPI